jgi:hypothetical protein
MMRNFIHPVTKYEALFDSLPTGVPKGHVGWNGTSVDAPLFGNGDLTGCFAGLAEAPQFWLSTNDFWEQKTDNWYPENQSVGPGRPRPLGRLVFDLPALAGVDVFIRQRFADAHIFIGYMRDNKTVFLLRAFTAATENLLVCELKTFIDIEVRAMFLFPSEIGFGNEDFSVYCRHASSSAYINNPASEYRVDNKPLMHGHRLICGNVDQETKLAFAGRFLAGDEKLSTSELCFADPDWSKPQSVPILALKSGGTVYYVLALRSAEKIINPEENAAARIESLTTGDIMIVEELHRSWWEDFWNVSAVETGDPLIDQRYYLSMYNLGSLCRDQTFPPNIFGVSTWDMPLWNGDYKINYNAQAPFWGLYASGHYEQADCMEAPFLAQEAQARRNSQKECGHGGALMPGGLGPKGLIAENMIYHMKSMGALAVANMAMRWYTSRDRVYARKIYSYLRGIVDFWEHDLEFDGQYYHAVNDHAHEVWRDVDVVDNPAVLGLIKCAMRLALDISEEFDFDAEKRPKWREIIEKIAPYAIGKAKDVCYIFDYKKGVKLSDVLRPEFLGEKEIFLLHRKGEDHSMICAVQLQQVYPAGDIGLNSDPVLLEAARNFLEIRIAQEEHYDDWGIGNLPEKIGRFRKKAAWLDENHSCIFFPAAVRIGYDSEKILAALRMLIENWGLPNGYIRDNPHGIENLSTIPNTVQEMMLLSHEGVLRFFRAWPTQSLPNANFRDLRAYGAFRVSARLEGGTVKDVCIFSDKGRPCSVEVFSSTPAVFDEAGREVSFKKKSGNIIEFETAPGKLYRVK